MTHLDIEKERELFLKEFTTAVWDDNAEQPVQAWAINRWQGWLAARRAPMPPFAAPAGQHEITRLDIMSMIRAHGHRCYASAIDREEIDTKYMREIEDALKALYAEVDAARRCRAQGGNTQPNVDGRASLQADEGKDALLRELLREADDLLWIARGAMLKMGLRDCGSDCALSHEVRMFALEFSDEGRDGPGALQIRGTGRYKKWLRAARNIDRAAITAKEGKKPIDYKSLLTKYMQHIVGMESVSYVDNLSTSDDFTPEELAELRQMAGKIYGNEDDLGPWRKP